MSDTVSYCVRCKVHYCTHCDVCNCLEVMFDEEDKY